MRKKLAGGAFIVAASLFAVHPSETNTGENSSVKHTTKDVLTGEVVEQEPEQIPITLVETIDGDTIKARVRGRLKPFVIYWSIPLNLKGQVCAISHLQRKLSKEITSWLETEVYHWRWRRDRQEIPTADYLHMFMWMESPFKKR
nr:hypothetical protein [Bacillus sp. UNC41MFS5]